MSRESADMRRRGQNAELARRAFEAANRGDLDAAFAHVHPDVEYVDPPEAPERRSVRGREAMKRLYAETLESFESFKFHFGDFIDAGDRTFHVLRLEGKGKESGAAVEMVWHQVAFIGPDGRVIRFENYLDRRRALEAAGLRPSDL
jgi:ketosteroid isomerase-like protein